MERLPDEFDAIPQGVFDTIPVISLMGAKAVYACQRRWCNGAEVSIVNRTNGGGLQVFTANLDHRGEILVSNTAEFQPDARLGHLRDVTGKLYVDASLRVAHVLGWE
ncbi:MAG: hypothetical protein UT33_C0005G0173 [Candidatus Peregrinibacteria bacterium GW2011_GWC2_39_14]|nr:MAG: hypothetical protein US92_C0001G0174 [Candidatus Peregrinibacteria bacterium GW2011_GWA2_38_36]KKR07229.1 MAG: hypothetical protein UT33_C0005G0173 [Candidatus Peregrinibacteria bacterium GW2011_GWC2_39_14]